MSDNELKYYGEDNSNVCPRCKQMLIKGNSICGNCGFNLENENEDKTEVLNFGLNTASIAINELDGIKSYYQQETPKIRKYRFIVNIILLLVGVFGILLWILPLFQSDNFFRHFETIADLYGIEFDSRLDINSGTTFISLIRNISGFSFAIASDFKPLYVLYFYELISVILVVAVMFISVFILVIAIKNIFSKENNKSYRTLLEIILIISYFLILGFNAYGIGTLILAILSTSCFIMFYICEIISHEKKFILRLLVYKAITFIILIVLSIISNFGLVRLNVTLGANLYTFANPTMSTIYGENVSFICRGLFYEIATYIQCSSGDPSLKAEAYIINGFSLLFHLAYLLMASISMGQLLKSLSKQTVRFPISFIIASVSSFYLFSLTMNVSNQIINDAFYNKYVTYRTTNELIIPQSFSVFYLRGGMIASMILNAPGLAFAIIANKEVVNKKYR